MDAERLLHHVGFTSSIAATDRPALTKKLEKLIAPPGFTGSAPGGPSRWNQGSTRAKAFYVRFVFWVVLPCNRQKARQALLQRQ